MKKNVIKNKSFGFAIRIVNVYKFLCNDKKEYILSKPLLRTGAVIGALYREPEFAETQKDFINNMTINN